MKLLGFRDLDELKPKFNLKHSIFMVPDDTRVKGSSSFFAHFLEAVHSRNRFVICSLVPRKGSPEKLVALIPQVAYFDEINGTETPAGFNVIFLPFAEEIRSIEYPVLEPERSFVDAALALIESASSHFNFESVQNPVLARHFSVLNRIALDQESIDDAPDLTEPDYQKLFENSSSFIKSFNDLVVSNVADVGLEKKRVSVTKQEKGVKRVKSESLMEEVRAAIESDQLKKLTVSKLVDFLASENQRVSSKKKADLLEQVKAFIASKSQSS